MKRIAGCLFVLSALAATTGCEQVNAWIDMMQKPTAELTGARLTGLDATSATLEMDVAVSNPYSLPLPLADFDYQLSSNAKTFLTGKTEPEGSIPANETRTITLPARITFAEALTVLTSVRPGQVLPYEAKAGLSVRQPIGGMDTIRLPLETSGQLPVPAPPGVSVRGLVWKQLNLDAARGELTLDLFNRNQFPIDLNAMQYTLSLAGAQVSDGGITQPASLAASGGSATLTIPVQFIPRSVGVGLFNALTGNGSGYSLGGSIEVGSPFGPITLPLNSSGNLMFSR